MGEELESRGEGAVSDEDPNELLHDRFGILQKFGKLATHLLQGRPGEFGPDPVPYSAADRQPVHGSRAWSVSLIDSRTHRVESGSRYSVNVLSAEADDPGRIIYPRMRLRRSKSHSAGAMSATS